MSFESCFGGFAGSKSTPAAMGGLPTFASSVANGKGAPKAVPVGPSCGNRINAFPFASNELVRTFVRRIIPTAVAERHRSACP